MKVGCRGNLCRVVDTPMPAPHVPPRVLRARLLQHDTVGRPDQRAGPLPEILGDLDRLGPADPSVNRFLLPVGGRRVAGLGLGLFVPLTPDKLQHQFLSGDVIQQRRVTADVHVRPGWVGRFRTHRPVVVAPATAAVSRAALNNSVNNAVGARPVPAKHFHNNR